MPRSKKDYNAQKFERLFKPDQVINKVNASVIWPDCTISDHHIEKGSFVSQVFSRLHDSKNILQAPTNKI